MTLTLNTMAVLYNEWAKRISKNALIRKKENNEAYVMIETSKLTAKNSSS